MATKTDGAPEAAGATGAFWAAWPAEEQEGTFCGDTELPHLLASDNAIKHSSPQGNITTKEN